MKIKEGMVEPKHNDSWTERIDSTFTGNESLQNGKHAQRLQKMKKRRMNIMTKEGTDRINESENTTNRTTLLHLLIPVKWKRMWWGKSERNNIKSKVEWMERIRRRNDKQTRQQIWRAKVEELQVQQTWRQSNPIKLKSKKDREMGSRKEWTKQISSYRWHVRRKIFECWCKRTRGTDRGM
jgi:hypothetical protein